MNIEFKKLSIKVIANTRHIFDEYLWNTKRIFNDEFARIYYLSRGYGFLSIRDKKRMLTPGFLYLIPSREDFMVHHSPHMDIVSLHFTASIDSAFDLFSIIKAPIKAPINNKSFIHKIIMDIQKIQEFNTSINSYKLGSLIKVLLIPFIEKAEYKNVNIYKYNPEFKNLLEYISLNCHKDLKINELAKSMHFHKNYFPAYFKKIMGKTPKEYLTGERIKRAKLLLFENKLSLKEISNQLGFIDTCYFNRVFREKTGMTPGVFSKQKII